MLLRPLSERDRKALSMVIMSSDDVVLENARKCLSRILAWYTRAMSISIHITRSLTSDGDVIAWILAHIIRETEYRRGEEKKAVGDGETEA